MEELDIGEFLEIFKDKDFSATERVILAHDGTVTTLLSTILNELVEVRIVAQAEWNDLILRNVQLITGSGVVADATSIIPVKKNLSEIVELVRERKLGLGQILAKCGSRPKRKIVHIAKDEKKFWRAYNLVGDGVDILVMEEFPTQVYEAIK